MTAASALALPTAGMAGPAELLVMLGVVALVPVAVVTLTCFLKQDDICNHRAR